MSSDAGGSRRRGALALGMLLLTAMFFLARGSLGFYSPRGMVAPGVNKQVVPERPRNRVDILVESVEETLGDVVSLRDLVEFYGLESATRDCTIQVNEGDVPSREDRIESLFNRRLRPGDEVTLCLD